MEVIFMALAAFAASLLTLFSGFGLGTILTPIFGIFFPLNIAVALTGIVHLLNNLFKLTFLGEEASRDLVLRLVLHPWRVGSSVPLLWLHSVNCLPFLPGNAAKNAGSHAVEVGDFGAYDCLRTHGNTARIEKPEFYWQTPHFRWFGERFFRWLTSGHQGALRTAFLVNCGLRRRRHCYGCGHCLPRGFYQTAYLFYTILLWRTYKSMAFVADRNVERICRSLSGKTFFETYNHANCP